MQRPNPSKAIALLAPVLWAFAFRAGAQEAADTAPTELPRMSVQDTATDEGYAVDTATGALKTDTPLLDTPMAVQIVPRELIDDQQARTSREAVLNVSGVQDTAQFYDQFLLRGFDSGYGTTFRDGLQLWGVNEAVNMAFVDHIEVVKGPSSMLYGRIEPGGFVNVVTRLPQATPEYSADVQGGNWGFFRATADATGPLTQDGEWLYRVIADLDQSDSWVDNAHRDNKAVSGALSWRPGPRFQADLQVEYYDYKVTWLDASIPVAGDRPVDLPRDFSILYPQSWTHYPYTTTRTLTALQWNFNINDDWRLTQRVHYVYSNEAQQGVYAASWTFDGVSQILETQFTHTAPDWIRTTFASNLDLVGNFTTGDLRHSLIIGTDWSKFTDDTPGSGGTVPGAAPIDIYHPVYGDYLATLRALAAQDATNVIYRDRSEDAGVYLQDQVAIGTHWQVLLGGRYDRATDAYSDVYGTRESDCYPYCTGRPVTPYPTDSEFSPRAGLLYTFDANTSAYASYSQSFGTSNGRDADGHPLDPQIGEQYEVGVKAVLLDGAVTTSATLFTLTKSNIPQYDPVNFFPHIVGEARSRGLELDVAGQLSEHFSVFGSYTYDQATITRDPYGGTEGNELSGVAPQVFNLWGKYDSAPGAADGWSLGAGVYASSQRQGDDENTWQMPGYARVDAMAGYRHVLAGTAVSLQLNVDNLFDTSYFAYGAYGTAAYGAPRTFVGELRVQF
ncbi:MAG: TonB-dependent siderophore receptor [Steroidobacteraceae bacterium]